MTNNYLLQKKPEVRSLIKSIINIFCIFCCFIFSTVSAQHSISDSKHSLVFKPEFFQIKEEANYGLVYNGVNLNFGYEYLKNTHDRLITYSTEFAFGIDFKKGVGLNWHLKPFDIYYGFEVFDNNNKIFHIGPYISANYYWQQYPFLQSGHMFWFTFIDVGPKIRFRVPINKYYITFSFSNSIAGIVSRPVPSTETHFYSLSISDFFKNAHSDFKFGSTNLLNHINVGAELHNQKRLSLAYEFEYFTYEDAPLLDYIAHSIILNWKIGKNWRKQR